MPRSKTVEIVVPMTIDVDGAPNTYGPRNLPTLDDIRNAYSQKTGEVVGFLTERDGKTPIVQGPDDPYPGYYISATSYEDQRNPRKTDPRRFVNAAEINYTLWAAVARDAGVRLGDFCVVHSLRTRFTVYAIVGDSGHSSGAEGSLALLQRLGYTNTKDGRSGGEDDRRIVVRYFAGTNPDKLFFLRQSDLETQARTLDLDLNFSSYHPGDPGKLVLTAVAQSGPALRGRRRALALAPQKDQAPLTPAFPIKLNSSDTAIVTRIQQRLRDLGFTQPGAKGPQSLGVDGNFGAHTAAAVKLFQSQHTNSSGKPLAVDGEIGPETWAALFPAAPVIKKKPRKRISRPASKTKRKKTKKPVSRRSSKLHPKQSGAA
jgi:hypothetical protein